LFTGLDSCEMVLRISAYVYESPSHIPGLAHGLLLAFVLLLCTCVWNGFVDLVPGLGATEAETTVSRSPSYTLLPSLKS
jgi:hypothetical protein